jgi:hypothetical protein
MSRHSRSLKEIPKTNIPLAQDSLKTARSDLKSAKALYDSECYPNAIYHLQQSLEKGWKSFGFYYGIITEGQARSRDIIGHKGSKVCTRTILAFKKVAGHMRAQVKALKNARNTDQNNQLPEVLDADHLKEFEDGIDVLLRELNNFAANEDKLRAMPYEEMKQLVDPLTDLQRSLDDIEQKLDNSQFRAELCEKIRQGAYRFWRPVVAGNPYAERILKKTVWEDLTDDMILDMMKYTIRGIAVSAPLFPLAVITQVHEQTTRYRMDGVAPESIYTASHPMIQLFPQIHTLSENTLINLERLYAELPVSDLLTEKEVPPP